MQQEDSECWLWGRTGTHCWKKLPWSCDAWLSGFPGGRRGLCPMGMRSKLAAGGGGREKSTGFGGASLAVAWSAEWKGTVKATELSTSLPPVLPAGLGKACQACQEKQPCGWSWSEGTCSMHGARSRKDTSIMRSEQECIVFVPLSVSLCRGSRECTGLTRTRPQPGEGFPRPSGG